jgi:hypothetical protein
MTTLIDSYTKSGAERLARTIERYWRSGAVKVWAEAGGDGFWFVRSNLVNGLPPQTKKQRAAA